MLNKLLKYDLQWVFKPLYVFYGLAIFFSIIVRVVESLEQTLIVLIIDKICCGVVIAMSISILINCFMRNWARFIRNMYKDESYLTHTLPIKKSNLYLSKILTFIISLIVSLSVIAICLAICILNKESFEIYKSLIEQSANMINISAVGLLLLFCITVFLEMLFIGMCGIVGIILGYRSNNLKIVKSIVYGFVIYMTLTLILLGLLYVLALFNPSVMEIFTTNQVNATCSKIVLGFGLVCYLIYCICLYFAGDKLFNKGVNVD